MLCFKGRCYPTGETSMSTDYTRAKRDFFNQDQKADLKRKMHERYTKRYGKQFDQSISHHLDEFFNSGAALNTKNIAELERRLQSQVASLKSSTQDSSNAEKHQTVQSNAEFEQTQENQIPPQSAPETSRKEMSETRSKLPQLSRTQLHEVQPVGWKNDEEKWGTIYKYNAYIFKQEQRLEKLKQQKRTMSVKQSLDEQVRERERQKQREKEQQLSFLTLNKQLKTLEKQNDDLKKDHIKDKIVFEREMRQKQIKDNRIKREREAQDEKDRDARAAAKIREELDEEKREAEDLKQKKLNEMKRVMQENEERKIIMSQRKELERLEDIELQRKAVEIGEELERQRQAEFKAKADRIKITSSEEAVSTMKKKQQESDYRYRRYQELKDEILAQKEKKDKQASEVRRAQLKEFLDKQAEEKKQREREELQDIKRQGDIWASETNQYKDYMEKKKKEKIENFQRYQADLRNQMEDKNRREAEMAALIITSDDVKMNQLMMNKVRQLKVEEDQLKSDIAQLETQDVSKSKQPVHA